MSREHCRTPDLRASGTSQRTGTDADDDIDRSRTMTRSGRIGAGTRVLLLAGLGLFGARARRLQRRRGRAGRAADAPVAEFPPQPGHAARRSRSPPQARSSPRSSASPCRKTASPCRGLSQGRQQFLVDRPSGRQHPLRAGAARAGAERHVEHLARDHAPHRSFPGHAGARCRPTRSPARVRRARATPRRPPPACGPSWSNGVYTYQFAQEPAGRPEPFRSTARCRIASASRSGSAARRSRPTTPS